MPAAAGASPRPLIALRGIEKTYASRDGSLVRAVDTVSAEIAAGEFISIWGPSGCGKSTLLMMIAGLLKPSGGEIRFHDQPVTEPQDDFGIVFQDPVLLPWRTVRTERGAAGGRQTSAARGAQRAPSRR